MIDAEVVLFAGRTILDVALPVVVGVAFLVIAGSFWLAILSPPVLVALTPTLRRRFGRGRLLHLMWAMGLVRLRDIPVLYSWRDSIAEFGP